MNIGYLRVSTDQQSVEAQKSGVIQYCEEHGVVIEKWVEEKVSGVKQVKDRKLGGIVPNMHKGDTLYVAELSRLGRSVSMITRLVERLLARKIKIVLVKQNLILGDDKAGAMGDMMTKMFIAVSALFAEMERDLIVARIKEGIRCKISSGYDWGSRIRGRRDFNCKTRRLEGKAKELLAQGVKPSQLYKKLHIGRDAARRMRRRIEAATPCEVA